MGAPLRHKRHHRTRAATARETSPHDLWVLTPAVYGCPLRHDLEHHSFFPERRNVSVVTVRLPLSPLSHPSLPTPASRPCPTPASLTTLSPLPHANLTHTCLTPASFPAFL